MKKVIKVNLGVVMALFAAFGLMSFKIYSGTSQMGWYEVLPESGGVQDIGAPIGPNLPEGDCQEDFEEEICAVFWPHAEDEIPGTLQEALLEIQGPAQLAKREE